VSFPFIATEPNTGGLQAQRSPFGIIVRDCRPARGLGSRKVSLSLDHPNAPTPIEIDRDSDR